MKARYLFVVFVLILATGLVVALDKNKPVRSLEGANAEESAQPELNKIVDLCATDKEEKFEKEWSKYVAQNDLKGDKLQDTIAWVSDEAAILRKKNRPINDDEINDEAWKEERQRLMKEFARRVSMP